jgi:hypothetical protein
VLPLIGGAGEGLPLRITTEEGVTGVDVLAGRGTTRGRLSGCSMLPSVVGEGPRNSLKRPRSGLLSPKVSSLVLLPMPEGAEREFLLFWVAGDGVPRVKVLVGCGVSGCSLRPTVVGVDSCIALSRPRSGPPSPKFFSPAAKSLAISELGFFLLLFVPNGTLFDPEPVRLLFGVFGSMCAKLIATLVRRRRVSGVIPSN